MAGPSNRQDGFEPHIFVAGLATAGAGDTRLYRAGLAEKFRQTSRPGGVERSPQRQLYGLDIQFAGFAGFGKDEGQQSV